MYIHAICVFQRTGYVPGAISSTQLVTMDKYVKKKKIEI